MKLYYFPGACSLSPHIVLRELGLPFELERVDLASKITESGKDFLAINPKGFIPALQLGNGQVLTEGPVIVQYLADQLPDKNLVPPAGSIARYRLMESLNYIATDLQKGFAPLFNPDTSDATRATVHANLARHFDYLASQLENSAHIAGDRFTVADALLFTVLNWAQYVAIDLAPWPALQMYLARIAERPAVKAAMAAENLAGA
ncbi:MAG: glutathione transferase GstA [Burkholderiaceae bacterium]|nr:glutathione transferase GstA [Burkholderiaceae bacterium]